VYIPVSAALIVTTAEIFVCQRKKWYLCGMLSTAAGAVDTGDYGNCCNDELDVETIGSLDNSDVFP
jgi:hypothetical protein